MNHHFAWGVLAVAFVLLVVSTLALALFFPLKGSGEIAEHPDRPEEAPPTRSR
jgi:hypothetical protein